MLHARCHRTRVCFLMVAGARAPDAAAVYRSMGSVLEQYTRRNRLVQELLSASEASTRAEQEHAATIRCAPAMQTACAI